MYYNTTPTYAGSLNISAKFSP